MLRVRCSQLTSKTSLCILVLTIIEYVFIRDSRNIELGPREHMQIITRERRELREIFSEQIQVPPRAQQVRRPEMTVSMFNPRNDP